MILKNIPGGTFIQGGTFIKESRVTSKNFEYNAFLKDQFLPLFEAEATSVGVPRVPTHLLKCSNGCQVPVLRISSQRNPISSDIRNLVRVLTGGVRKSKERG